MIEGNVHTIEELVTKYEFEPTLRDIFVEGKRDKIFFEIFLSDCEYSHAKVYEISTIYFSEEKYRPLDLPLRHNNRNKVIALMHKIFSQLKDANQVRGIADRDFDIILENANACPYLFFTDYTCLEMYSFNPRVLSRFLTIILGGFAQTADVVLEELAKTLQRLFLIRLVAKVLRLDMVWLKNLKCFDCKDYRLFFDETQFIIRYLNMNHKLSAKEQFLSVMKDYEKCLTADPRNQIRGHDYIHILGYYLKKCGNKGNFAPYDVVEGCIFSCIEIKEFLEEGLAKKLTQWLQNAH